MKCGLGNTGIDLKTLDFKNQSEEVQIEMINSIFLASPTSCPKNSRTTKHEPGFEDTDDISL